LTRPDPEAPLPPAFFARPCEVVARELLGARLVSLVGGERAEARIVETEAYVGPHDPASHAADRIGRTARNRSMYGPPGRAYVYRSYGVHWCLNLVTDADDYPAAVLVRAAQPLAGIEVIRRRRARPGAPCADRDLLRGPGRLAQGLGIDHRLDGHPVTEPPLLVLPGEPLPVSDIVAAPRVGITRAIEWPLRFFERRSRWISRR
jgi:DNA-3-methyladenine glycosylase